MDLTDFYEPEYIKPKKSPGVDPKYIVKLYRGVQKGNENSKTIGDGLFKSPDKKIAEMYANGGSVSEDLHRFNNLLEATNWIEAKDKLGLPKSTSMEDLIIAARKEGYDGMTFNTTNGKEYVVLGDNTRIVDGMPTEWEPVMKDAIIKQRQGNKFSIVPEKGSALVEGMAGVTLPIAVHYANQATHGEFNPLDIKSAGEGSEVEANHEQPYNSLQEMYRRKKLDSLKQD